MPTWKQWFEDCNDGAGGGNACDLAETTMHEEIGDNIDPYALDYPVCLNPVRTSERFWFLKEVVRGALGRPIQLFYQNILENKVVVDGDFASEFDHVGNYQPCESNWMTDYLNEKSVQTAIHAVLKGKVLWQVCGGVNYDSSSSLIPMEPTWKWIIANDPGLHITIVSGDDDSVCGTLGTQSWIYDMGYPISSEWSAWTDANGQTGGYLIKFECIQFYDCSFCGTFDTLDSTDAIFGIISKVSGRRILISKIKHNMTYYIFHNSVVVIFKFSLL
jgi:hypothetical protein